MTKEEFKNLLDEFFGWASPADRPASGWFWSLEQWATSKGEACYLEEGEARKKEPRIRFVMYRLPHDAVGIWREERMIASSDEEAVLNLQKMQPEAQQAHVP